MSPLGAQPNDFVRVRELDLAITFLSSKIDDGFKRTHDLQRDTVQRLAAAEGEIQALKRVNAVEGAVEQVNAKTREKYSTLALSALSGLGGIVLGGVAAFLKKTFGW